MLESINDLYREVDNAVKRIGHAELCLSAAEIDMLKQLIPFLKEFEKMTSLVGTNGPNLSLVALMELKIRRLCKVSPQDDDWLQEVKSKVTSNVGRRLTSSEASKVQRILDPDTKALVDEAAAVATLREVVKKCVDRGIMGLTEQQPQDEFGLLQAIDK
jgi:hypothetical protein